MPNNKYSHKPPDWTCPLCGIADEQNAKRLDEVIYEDDRILAFISRDWWPNNPGHVLIVPRKHDENIYELPFVVSDRIHRMAKRVAIALKALHHCDGVSIRQHNEPAGNQDVWHYHLHVFPRFNGDRLYVSQKQLAPLQCYRGEIGSLGLAYAQGPAPFVRGIDAWPQMIPSGEYCESWPDNRWIPRRYWVV